MLLKFAIYNNKYQFTIIIDLCSLYKKKRWKKFLNFNNDY